MELLDKNNERQEIVNKFKQIIEIAEKHNIEKYYIENWCQTAYNENVTTDQYKNLMQIINDKINEKNIEEYWRFNQDKKLKISVNIDNIKKILEPDNISYEIEIGFSEMLKKYMPDIFETVYIKTMRTERKDHYKVMLVSRKCDYFNITFNLDQDLIVKNNIPDYYIFNCNGENMKIASDIEFVEKINYILNNEDIMKDIFNTLEHYDMEICRNKISLKRLELIINSPVQYENYIP